MAQDIIHVLADDHALLQGVIDRLRHEVPTRERPQRFNQFARALGAHITMIDDAVIPALKRFGWRGVSSSMLTGHVELKRSLAELLTRAHDAALEPSLTQLLFQLQAQIDMERAQFFPLLQQCLDDQQRAFLGMQAQGRRVEILGDEPAGDLNDAPAWSDLLEEAHVVLGSLPRPPAPADAPDSPDAPEPRAFTP